MSYRRTLSAFRLPSKASLDSKHGHHALVHPLCAHLSGVAAGESVSGRRRIDRAAACFAVNLHPTKRLYLVLVVSCRRVFELVQFCSNLLPLSAFRSGFVRAPLPDFRM